MLGRIAAGLRDELGDLTFTGPRARFATTAALSVTLATFVALATHMHEPWWAAVSGFMSSQATLPGSVQRATFRFIGTAAGAMVSLVATPWIAYNHFGGALLLLIFATVAGIGTLVSAYAYIWLFTGITANIIIMSSLQDPTAAFSFAFYRTVEVAIGSLSALVVSNILTPDGPPPPPTTAPGWSDLLGRQWPAVLHAVRLGVAVMLLPFVWNWFEFPSLSQGAITIAAVMAVPALSGRPEEDVHAVVQRAVQRLIGCILGGSFGLLLLAWPLEQFVTWLIALAGGIWLAVFVQTGQRGVSYVGTQFALVFIMTLIQGWTPPSSITPGVQRAAGMTAGLLILLVVTLLIWPATRQDELASTEQKP